MLALALAAGFAAAVARAHPQPLAADDTPDLQPARVATPNDPRRAEVVAHFDGGSRKRSCRKTRSCSSAT
jgi:hypothetical protein